MQVSQCFTSAVADSKIFVFQRLPCMDVLTIEGVVSLCKSWIFIATGGSRSFRLGENVK